jgi:NADH-quinone oxidoreductase subunit N
MWTPDVYEGAPTPVTALLAAAPKVAAMVLFARVLSQAFPHDIPQWSQVVTAIALISVTVGALGGLVQKNLKRLLAYSSIANIGYALLGLASGSEAGLQAMLMFLVLYVIDVTGFFACLLALSRGGKPMETLPSLAGLVRLRPGLAIAITILSLSVLGLPPLSGFWAKFYVFKAAVSTHGMEPAAVYGLVMSVAAAFYYLRIIKTMWFDPPEGATDAPPLDARLVALGSAAFSFPLVIPALAVLDPLALAAAKAFGLA